MDMHSNRSLVNTVRPALGCRDQLAGDRPDLIRSQEYRNERVAGFFSRSNCRAAGRISFKTSSRFASSSGIRRLTPVMLCPGRDMLSTNPRAPRPLPANRQVET
jgi:hypothetical protein